MLTPEYLLHVGDGAEEIAAYLHNKITVAVIKAILNRAQRGDDYILTRRDAMQLEVLQEAGYLLSDITAEIAAATLLQQTEIMEAMEEAGTRAMAYEDRIYQAAGISPKPLTQSSRMIRLMQRNYEAVMGEWENFTKTTANSCQQLFIRECDNAYNMASTGAVSYTSAFREAIDRIAADGVRVTYPSGHTDTIETATLRCVRTGISQATAQIQLARMEEERWDLVLTSSHMGARPTHEPWQGKVFHVDWETFEPYKQRTKDDPIPEPKSKSPYPDFVQSTRYGYVDGLCGANCRHHFSAWREGMGNPFEQYDTDESRKEYELQQRQRLLERRIRKTKREVLGLREAIENAPTDEDRQYYDERYQRKAVLLQRQNADYREFCEENDLKVLSERLAIAQWDRQQAAAARGAARRYKNSKLSE